MKHLYCITGLIWLSLCLSFSKRNMGVTEGTFWELSSVWPDNWSHPCHLDRLLGNSMTWKILILVPKGKHFLSSFIVYPKTTFSYKVQDMAVSIHHLALSFHRPDIPWHFLWLNSCCWILYSMEKCDLCKEKHGKVREGFKKKKKKSVTNVTP